MLHHVRHGFLLVDKPVGMTSHDVVAEVRRTLGERRIGHLGTLDPSATGLLVLAIGAKALKMIELFADLPKEYEAQVRFGAVSTTYDSEGVITEIAPQPGWSQPAQSTIQRTIEDRFLGRIQQVPPVYSAVHVGGERAYRKARRALHRSVATGAGRGSGVAIPAREVLIERCEILSYEYPVLRLAVRCGSGTYIRSLAHDLGAILRCGGYLASLRRTRVGLPVGAQGAKAGDWSLRDAVPLGKVTWAHVIPLKEVLRGFPALELSADEFEELSRGQNIFRDVQPNTIGWYDDLPVALLIPAGDGEAHARKVL